MTSNKNQGDLLSRLHYLSGCQYLSDLHNSFYIEDILYALPKIKIASYSAQEWTEAYRYITGRQPESASKERMAAALVRWLDAEKAREL